jgi:DnaJ-class molecular chaperone
VFFYGDPVTCLSCEGRGEYHRMAKVNCRTCKGTGEKVGFSDLEEALTKAGL